MKLSKKKLKLLYQVATDGNREIKASKFLRALGAAGANVSERIAETTTVKFNGTTATLGNNNIGYWREGRAKPESSVKNNRRIQEVAGNVLLAHLINDK
jgi:hypothetical protein